MKRKQGRVTERSRSQRVEQKEIKKFISREGLCLLDLPANLTVLIMSIPSPSAAAGATIELLDDDVAGEQVAQGGDGIGDVTLRALGCPSACNLGVG